jgi:hypothetical protein
MRPSVDRLVRFATAYDSDPPAGDEIVFTLPEDLTGLDDAELAQLRDDAVEAFDVLYESEEPSAQDVEAMSSLADAADAIRGEQERREQERAANREAAEDLASRIRPADEPEDAVEDGPEVAAAEEPTEAVEELEVSAEVPETVAASAQRPGPISITLSGVRRRQPQAAPQAEPAGPASLVASADLGAGLPGGEPASLAQIAQALGRRASGINESSYRQAFRNGKRLTQSFGVLAIERRFDDTLTASADDATDVLAAAANESRLPGGSLVASGGWCSPSETLYDLFEVESTDGLVSVPEIGVTRGGIRHTRGPDFASLFGATGFTFTEQQDIDGEYVIDGEGEPADGPKPCYKVECPSFVEDRLNVTGLCITAGILQNRAYPEVTERTIRGALVGHAHRMAGQTIAEIAAGSTAVAMPADQVGAFAPILTAIELQVEHYRYVHRLGRATSLEAIFPFWTRGVIRSDLARRLGVPVQRVTNAMIGEHFADHGVSPQFVYNYQDISGGADAFTEWPTEVKFLLYAAGTWVRGVSDLVTLEAVFDSSLFTLNDFTALFTEEGWLVARRGHDSREVTVPICGNGATHGGVMIDCDGSAGDEYVPGGLE